MNTGIEGPESLFASPLALRAAFEDRLVGLLEHDLLGVFILVLANASFEERGFARLREPLAAAYERWCERLDRDGRTACGAAVDDIEVFRRLRLSGFEGLTPTRWRRVGPWELQYNPLRALRPPRMSTTVVHALRKPFDPDAFHFNKPFLRSEVFWEGDLSGAPVRVLYNKFPFADVHGLLVPYPDAQRPQFLERDDHALIWTIARQLGETLPGIGFGYNAYGAYASVNHLHFQMFMRSEARYAIESARWRHNGGDRAYPLAVQRHADPEAAWTALAALHAVGVSYNLLYRPGTVYIVPRAMQGGYRHSRWTAGFAWSEIAGAVTTFTIDDFERLRAADIEAEFTRLVVA